MSDARDRAQVYVIEQDGVYKIGHSSNPVARVRQLATGTASQARLVLLINCWPADVIEAALHRHFFHKHVVREWFDLAEEDLRWLRTLAGRAGLDELRLEQNLVGIWKASWRDTPVKPAVCDNPYEAVARACRRLVDYTPETTYATS